MRKMHKGWLETKTQEKGYIIRHEDFYTNA